MERTFHREVQALDSIFGFIAEVYRDCALGDAHRSDTQLIVEELFTNMVRHARGGRQDIAIRLEPVGSLLRIELTDFGVEPFDPTQAPAVNIRAPLSERRPGGLGLHLVRKLSESMDYRYENGKSTIVVQQRVEG